MPSLHEIEKTVATLWLSPAAREWLISGKKGPMPEELKGAPKEILESVDQRGVELYGSLLAFGHHDVMDSIYPYCAKIIAKQWEKVVDDYLLKFPPRHYNFNRLCAHLSEYFTKYGGGYTQKYPYLPELADYEWIELEKLEEDADFGNLTHEQLTSPEQIVSMAPVVNPTLTIREYTYNIPELVERLESVDRVSKVTPEQTFVAIYRHPETQRCKFVEIGEAAARIVERARQLTSYQMLIPLAVELTPELSAQEAVSQFLEVVEDLQELRVFVGSQKVG